MLPFELGRPHTLNYLTKMCDTHPPPNCQTIAYNILNCTGFLAILARAHPGTAETDETGFWRFCHYPTGAFPEEPPPSTHGLFLTPFTYCPGGSQEEPSCSDTYPASSWCSQPQPQPKHQSPAPVTPAHQAPTAAVTTASRSPPHPDLIKM